MLLLSSLAATLASSQSLFPVRDSSYGEARNRTYHVVHYAITIAIDEQHKSIHGRTSITLVPFLPDVRTVSLDAEQLQIDKVSLAGKSNSVFGQGPSLRIACQDAPTPPFIVYTGGAPV